MHWSNGSLPEQIDLCLVGTVAITGQNTYDIQVQIKLIHKILTNLLSINQNEKKNKTNQQCSQS